METNTEIIDNDSILGTAVTWHYVQAKLQKVLHTKAQFGKNKTVKRIGQTQGLACLLARMHFDWTNISETENLPETLVIKIATAQTTREWEQAEVFKGRFQENRIDEAMKGFLPTIHRNEVQFYKWFQQSGISTSHIMRCYTAEECCENLPEGFIIMNDIGENAHVSLPHENLNVEDLFQVFDTLAVVQAHSLRTNDWKKIFNTQLQLLKSLEKLIDKISSMCKKSPILNEGRNAELMDEVLKNIKDIINPQKIISITKELGMVPVLVHGDLWTNNVIWREEKNGERKLAGIIDWQLCHLGCAAEDLARLIACSLSASMRRKSWRHCIEAYYEMLKAKLGHIPPFTLHQLKQGYVKLFPFAGFVTLTTLGPVVELYTALKLENGPDIETIKSRASEKSTGLLKDILRYHNYPETVCLDDSDN